jgi:hypothetical protein
VLAARLGQPHRVNIPAPALDGRSVSGALGTTRG